jgi:hypothetical protein
MPYRFVGALNDEVRNLDVMGQRLYQPREQVFYRPEPLLSTRFSVGQVFHAWTQAKRHSRLWQSLVRLALTDRSDRLKAFTERFSAKPLLGIELSRTDKGFELQSAKAGFLIWDWSIFEKPAVPAGQQSAATTASTPASGASQASAPRLRPTAAMLAAHPRSHRSQPRCAPNRSPLAGNRRLPEARVERKHMGARRRLIRARRNRSDCGQPRAVASKSTQLDPEHRAHEPSRDVVDVP